MDPEKLSFLEKLGLHRRELRAWAMYNWATTGFYVIVVVAVFPLYFQYVASEDFSGTEATRVFATITTLGLVMIAAISPILGAITDYVAIKKKLLATFVGLGVVSVAAMFFIQEGDWILASALFILANIAVNGSVVFYDSMLPHIASHKEIDRVSTGAFGVGYAGATVLLICCLAVIMEPTLFGLPEEGTLPTRLSFVAVALWWALFTIPLLLRVPEPPTVENAKNVQVIDAVRGAIGRLLTTFRELKRYKQAVLMLVAFLIYNDGIGTIIRMAAIYGAEIGLEQSVLVGSIVVVQVVGIPCAFLFGGLAAKIGTKQALFGGLVVYMGISILGYFMTTGLHFVILAVLVGMVQGGTQALSRSLFATLIPRQKAGEFFGFFSVFEKFAGIFGPAIFAVMIYLTGSSREAILSIIGFFIVGGILLYFVDIEEGRAQARQAEAEFERDRTIQKGMKV